MGERPSAATLEKRYSAIIFKVGPLMQYHPDSAIAAAWNGVSSNCRAAVARGVAVVFTPPLDELAPYIKAYLTKTSIPDGPVRQELGTQITKEIDRLTSERSMRRTDEATLRRRLAAQVAQYALVANSEVNFPIETQEQDTDGLIIPTDRERDLAFVQSATRQAIARLPDDMRSSTYP